MAYHSVEEILTSIDATRARLSRGVEKLSDAQENFRPAPGAWSAAEIIEHLSIIEGRIAQMLGMMLAKAEAEGHHRADGAPFAPVDIEAHVERSRREKYTAPEAARPTGALALSDSLARLRQSRAAIQNMRPQLERVDGTLLRYPHPAFGPLNLYQWLAFIGVHEERHLRQIETLMQSFESRPETGAGAADVK